MMGTNGRYIASLKKDEVGPVYHHTPRPVALQLVGLIWLIKVVVAYSKTCIGSSSLQIVL